MSEMMVDRLVFVSCSPADADSAMAVCSELESRNLRCWIAPRDIDPADNHRDAVAEAIRHAKVMLLVFSTGRKGSGDMTNELALASQYALAIVPICVDDVVLHGAPANAPAAYSWIALFRSSPSAIDRLAARIAAMAAVELPAAASHAPQPSHPVRAGGAEFAAKFIGNLIVFGFVGALLSSWFPVVIGLLLFFPADAFIEWALAQVGIRLVPDTLGPQFIKAFVFMAGWLAMLVYWKRSAPTWLLPWIPPSLSWSIIAGAVLLIAALTTLSAAVMRKLLPRVGIKIAPDSLRWTTIEFLVGLSMLALLVPASMVLDWFGIH
jgi:TIR domain-containing protein